MHCRSTQSRSTGLTLNTSAGIGGTCQPPPCSLARLTCSFCSPGSILVSAAWARASIIIGIGGLLLGLVLMFWAMGAHKAFFRRKLEVADRRALDDVAIAAAGADTIAPDDTIEHAAVLMIHGGYRHLPVLDGDEVVGVLSIRDLVQVVVEDSAPRGA